MIGVTLTTMAIKCRSILILIGVLSTLFGLTSCTTSPECIPCNQLDNPTNEQFYDLGCISFDEANDIIDSTNQLVEYVNEYSVEKNGKKLNPLPYYVKGEVNK